MPWDGSSTAPLCSKIPVRPCDDSSWIRVDWLILNNSNYQSAYLTGVALNMPFSEKDGYQMESTKLSTVTKCTSGSTFRLLNCYNQIYLSETPGSCKSFYDIWSERHGFLKTLAIASDHFNYLFQNVLWLW